MRRGPAPGARARTDFAAALTARVAQPEDWLMVLAQEANRIGLKRLAPTIGYSSSTLSQVLSGTCRGSLPRIEQAVRGALMGLTVACPALSAEIGRETCLKHQRSPLSTASPTSVRLFHACRSGCPNARSDDPSN